MKKFNHKYNISYERLKYWDAISQRLTVISDALKEECNLTPEDMQVLQSVQQALNECRQRVSEQRKHHAERL